MTFSNDVRNELARTRSEKICCQKAELAALCICSGRVNIGENGDIFLNLTVDNAATARKAFSMFKKLYHLQAGVRIAQRKFFKKNRYYIVSTVINAASLPILEELGYIDKHGQVSRKLNWSLLSRACCKRAFLRGIFLNRGFVNRPEGNYHLEIICRDNRMADDIKKILASFNLEARDTERKNTIVVYFKESEKIVDFLRLVGANKALLKFENVRILKSMRNKVNRQVNCETANLAKTVEASVRQVELINGYVEQKGWDTFPDGLRELAVIRVEHPDLSLKELGEMLNPPLSKSGVAYRMRRLENLITEDTDQ